MVSLTETVPEDTKQTRQQNTADKQKYNIEIQLTKIIFQH